MNLSLKQVRVLMHLKKTWSVGQWFNGLHGDNSHFQRIETTLLALQRRGFLDQRMTKQDGLVRDSFYDFCLTDKAGKLIHLSF